MLLSSPMIFLCRQVMECKASFEFVDSRARRKPIYAIFAIFVSWAAFEIDWYDLVDEWSLVAALHWSSANGVLVSTRPKLHCSEADTPQGSFGDKFSLLCLSWRF